MGIFENSEKAWAIYTHQLEKLVGEPSGPVGFQVSRVLRPLDFLTEHPELNLFHKLGLADTLPNWHPTYSESAGGRVSAGYERFLLELNKHVIDTSPHPDPKALAKLLEESEKAREKLTDFMTKIDKEWKAFKAENSGAFRDEWERRRGYDTATQMLRNTLNDKLGRYLAEANVAPEVIRVANAWGLYNAPNAQIRLPEAPEIAGDEDKDLWTLFYKTFIDGDFQKFADREVNVAVSFGEGSESSSHFESGWNGSASVSYFFFSVSGGASGGTVIDHVRSSSTSVDFGFKNLAQFAIRRSTWFDETLIREFSKRVDHDKFWGPNGVLSILPTSIVVGRGLRMRIEMTNATRDEFHTWYQANARAGISFGPWTIGGGGGSSSRRDEVTVTKEEGAIVIEDKSDTIFLVAVSSERPGYFGSERFVEDTIKQLFESSELQEREMESKLIREPLQLANPK